MAVIAQTSSGEFRQVAIAPLVVHVGDSVQQIGSQIVVTRNGQVIATRELSGQSVSVSSVVEVDQVIDRAIFFRRNPVAGQSVVVTGVFENAGTGVIRIKYSNGNEREFSNWADVGTQLGSMDQESTLAENILAYKSFINSPDGTNKTTMLNVNCAVNFQAGTPIALIEV